MDVTNDSAPIHGEIYTIRRLKYHLKENSINRLFLNDVLLYNNKQSTLSPSYVLMMTFRKNWTKYELAQTINRRNEYWKTLNVITVIRQLQSSWLVQYIYANDREKHFSELFLFAIICFEEKSADYKMKIYRKNLNVNCALGSEKDYDQRFGWQCFHKAIFPVTVDSGEEFGTKAITTFPQVVEIHELNGFLSSKFIWKIA